MALGSNNTFLPTDQIGLYRPGSLQEGYGTQASLKTILGVPSTATETVAGTVLLATTSTPAPGSDVNVPTQALVENLISDAVTAALATLPADVFLSGVGGYNAGTNVLTLNMSDGSTVPVDLTTLVTDAVNSVPAATDIVAGKVALAVAANYPSASDVEATTPAYVTAAVATAIGGIPVIADATDTTAGKVSLAVAANYPADVALDDVATTPAYVAAAIAAAEDDITAIELTAVQTPTGAQNLNVSATEGGTTITGTAVQIPTWVTGLDIAANVDATAFGLGRILNAVDNAAMTDADVVATNMNNTAASVGMLRHVLTNRAVEGNAAVNAGMRNADGTLGNYSAVRGGGADVVAGQAALNATVAGYNGATQRLTLAPGSIVTMPTPAYFGQVLHVQTVVSGSPFSEIVLDFPSQTNLVGVYRRRDHIISAGSVTFNEIIMRSGETVSLLAISATNWMVVNHSYRLLSTTVISEQSDGTAILQQLPSFATSINPGDNFVIDSPLAATITNPTAIFAQITDVDTVGGVSLGVNGMPIGARPFTFNHVRGDNTVSTIRVSAYNSGTLAGAPTAVTATVFNAVLDYAALGGVASF
jgi:hypothetical protein